MYNKQTISPFAALEKRAFGRLLGSLGGKALGAVARNPLKTMAVGAGLGGLANTTPGQGFIDTAAGKLNAGVTGAINGLRSNLAGGAALLTGGDATAAKNQAWNAGQEYINQQNARADTGWNKATGWLGGAKARVERPLTTAGAGIEGARQGFEQGGFGGALQGAGGAINDQWNRATKQINQLDQQATTGVLQGGQPVAPQPTPAAPAPQSAPAGPSANPMENIMSAGQISINPSAGGFNPAAMSAPTPAAPTPGQLSQFQRGTTTPFNPKSQLDIQKMRALMAGQRNWADNSAARQMLAGQ